MAGWHHEGAFKMKQCLVCDKEFVPFSGAHKFCSEQCKGKWKYISGEMTTERQYEYISGNWERYFCRLVNRSQKRENFTVEECLELLKEQEGRCALSGIELTCKLEKGTKFLTNASLDRVEAGGPYIKDNIQLVCSALNSWRNSIKLEEFIWWCKQVSQYNAE